MGGVGKEKSLDTFEVSRLFVGVTRFELATTRPPDAYSNRAELHPERCIEFRVTLSIRDANIGLFFKLHTFSTIFLHFFLHFSNFVSING